MLGERGCVKGAYNGGSEHGEMQDGADGLAGVLECAGGALSILGGHRAVGVRARSESQIAWLVGKGDLKNGCQWGSAGGGVDDVPSERRGPSRCRRCEGLFEGLESARAWISWTRGRWGRWR